jgi:hypothetical protein
VKDPWFVVPMFVIGFLFVSFGGWLAFGLQQTANRAAAHEAEEASIELTASSQPPLRTIPLVDRLLNCYTFPIRSYNNQLLSCVACIEEYADDFERKRPVVLECK